MNISVIIPVYKAENYLEKAVQSALSQPEVNEILLVEDNSPDNSLKICHSLDDKYSIIKVVRHSDCKNHGAAATRNLGIKKASNKYIAFLDADDYYLPERFKFCKILFENDSSLDGVYEAIGMHFYSKDAEIKWSKKRGGNLTTISNNVTYDKLFEELLNNRGYLHLDGLVVNKNIFDRCGYFPDHLRLHQDTAMFFQLSGIGKLAPGCLNSPVANRGIHDENRILSNYDARKTSFMLWRYLFYWSCKNSLAQNRQIMLFERYILSVMRLIRTKNIVRDDNHYLLLFIKECIAHPIMSIIAFTHKVLRKK